MNYSYETIRSVELEISTYCNAACPQCPRNEWGGKTIAELPLVNWSLSQLQSMFDIDFIQQLDIVYFCGTFGDPLANKNLIDMCQWLREVSPKIKLGIHTNGGIGRVESYKKLAKLVNFIAFGIDGLEDTNHLYRRNVSWKKVIKNAQSFINEGGYAIWDFIVFRHNQHQVEEAMNLSQSMGFKEFNIKKTGRFFNKAHVQVDKIDVLDRHGNKEYELELPDENYAQYINHAYKDLQQINFVKYLKETKITCYWMKHNMLYIGADGYVFPCGFLHDRLYGLEATQHSDYDKILSMMDNLPGREKANIFSTHLRDIVDGPWFNKIKTSWDSDRLERCALLCGDRINLLADQNATIKYKTKLSNI